jgi:hypothetical protein
VNEARNLLQNYHLFDVPAAKHGAPGKRRRSAPFATWNENDDVALGVRSACRWRCWVTSAALDRELPRIGTIWPLLVEKGFNRRIVTGEVFRNAALFLIFRLCKPHRAARCLKLRGVNVKQTIAL